MSEIRIIGYADQISVQSGDKINFMLSAEGTDSVKGDIVKLIHGDEHPDGPGFIEKEVNTDLNGQFSVKKQYVQIGSFIEVEDPKNTLDLTESFTLYAFIWPTTPTLKRQGILSRWSVLESSGYALGINSEGKLEFWVGDGKNTDKVYSEIPLEKRMWYFVAASYDNKTQTVSLYQEPTINNYNSLLSPIVPFDYTCHTEEKLRIPPVDSKSKFLIAGCNDYNVARGAFVNQIFNGKIDRCGVQVGTLSRPELDLIRQGESPSMGGMIAHWDPTIGYTEMGIGDEVVDVGPNKLNGLGINRPIRAATGYNWQGKEDCFRLDPNQYGGMAFHDDIVIDCKWESTAFFSIPENLQSGVYAFRTRAGDVEDHIPFFVRAAKPKAKIAFLVPTASYMAYANERMAFDVNATESIGGHTPILSKYDLENDKRLDFGLSTYDHHSDEAGVCYSSYRRPIYNLRPKHRNATTAIPWGLGADLSIVGWLEHLNYEYEVITDEDLHRDGMEVLRPYSVIINGVHPEYYSERMMDATETYLDAGGRLIYTGGNGYYWVSSFREDESWCMEVRKLESGSRAWQAMPGEHYHATSGERGGIWKNRGRAPQKLTGVGLATMGMDKSMPYIRMPDGYHKFSSWIFKGIDPDEQIGGFGLALGGAAGIEIDRYDLTLGTPPHTKILASSDTFSDYWTHVQEEILFNYPGMRGSEDYQVRADMTYLTTRNNGAVFSTGSMAWAHALPYNGFDNNVSRVMANIVDAFCEDGKLPGFAFIAKEKHWK